MFKNLKAEMAREGLERKAIALGIGVSERSFGNKMTGRSEFTRSEMLKIHKKYFPKCSIEYLFEMGDQQTA